MLRPLILVIFIALIGGCAHQPPLEEYTLARTALDAARRIEAARYAPGAFHTAEEAFRQGESSFKDKRYDDAEEEFSHARVYAEKAENTARLKRFQSGEDVP